MTESLPHSAIYFGDTRDHWWDADFVALMARRLDLTRFRRVLDVGCGYGHWTRVWLPHFAPGTRVTGIDPEARSVAEASARTAAFASHRQLDVTLEWTEARAEALPFPDQSFDLVTAQTVLIHLPDVAAAITELHRVLAPGGLLLVAEPNNLAGACGNLVDGPLFDVDRLLTLTALEARIQLGKSRLGEGCNSAGEYVVKYLDPARFTGVQSWMCDRPYLLAPPYDTPQQRAEIAEYREFFEKGWHGRPTDEARRYYLAGGGDEAGFAAAWAAGLAFDAERLRGIEAGTYVLGGGSVFHLIAATRRSA